MWLQSPQNKPAQTEEYDPFLSFAKRSRRVYRDEDSVSLHSALNRYDDSFWDKILQNPSEDPIGSNPFSADPLNMFSSGPAELVCGHTGRDLCLEKLPSPGKLMGRKRKKRGQDSAERRAAAVTQHITELRRKQSFIDELKGEKWWGSSVRVRSELGCEGEAEEEEQTEAEGESHTHTLQDRAPHTHTMQNRLPYTHTLQDGAPNTHTLQDRAPHTHTLQNGVPYTHTMQDGAPHTHTLQDRAPHTHTLQNGVPYTHSLHDGAPQTHTLQDRAPHTHSLQDGAPHTHTLQRVFSGCKQLLDFAPGGNPMMSFVVGGTAHRAEHRKWERPGVSHSEFWGFDYNIED